MLISIKQNCGPDKEVLRLLDCDVQKLEDQIFSTGIEEEGEEYVAAFDTIYSSKANKKNDINNSINRKANNIQRNESLDKYQSPIQIFVVLRLPGIIYN
ncbi:MAG: hypothetical protein WCF03_11875 [Nitrososphaeraceae archaeon]